MPESFLKEKHFTVVSLPQDELLFHFTPKTQIGAEKPAEAIARSMYEGLLDLKMDPSEIWCLGADSTVENTGCNQGIRVPFSTVGEPF